MDKNAILEISQIPLQINQQTNKTKTEKIKQIKEINKQTNLEEIKTNNIYIDKASKNQTSHFGGGNFEVKNPVDHFTTPHIHIKPMRDVEVQSKLLSQYVRFVNPTLNGTKRSPQSIMLDGGCNSCLVGWSLYRYLTQAQLIIKEEKSSLSLSKAVHGESKAIYLKITFNLEISSPLMKRPVIHTVQAHVSAGELNTGVGLLLGTTYIKAYGISDITSHLT